MELFNQRIGFIEQIISAIVGSAAEQPFAFEHDAEFLRINRSERGDLNGVISDLLDFFQGFRNVFRRFRVLVTSEQLSGKILL